MQGTVKGKEGTSVKRRQGRTRFDCQKWKKLENEKFGRVFLQTGGVLGRKEGTAVFSEARRTQRCVRNSKTNFFSKTGRQAPQKKPDSSIEVESS